MTSNPSYATNTFPAAVLAAPVSGSTELVIAYAEQGMSQILGSYRVNGTWMGFGPITGVTSSDALAMAPLASGGAVLAYRGTNGNLYTALYASSWAMPTQPFTSPTAILGAPAVARGIGTAAAEMAYLDVTGALWHTRFIGGTWTTPTPVAMGTSGFATVAIASGP